MLRWLFGTRSRAWEIAACVRGLAPKDRDRLAAHVAERRLAPGEVLVEEGELASELFIVSEGSLDVSRRGDDGPVALGRVETGEVVGEVALFDRGPRSATARAKTPCVVHAIPFACIVGGKAGLSAEGKLHLLTQIGGDLARRVRAGGEASTEAARRGEAMGQFLVSIMTLQCIYAITLTTLPLLDGFLPASTTYVSIPLQLIFGVAGMGFILRTRLPLRLFGLGLHGIVGSTALSIATTLPVLVVLAGVKWLLLRLSGVALPVIEHPDIAAVAASPTVQRLFAIYVVSCVVQEIIVRSALQSSLHLFLTGKGAELRTITVCALVFATNHLHMSPLFAAAVLLPGMLWGWMFARYRNVTGVILSHVVVGAFVFFVLGVNVG